MRVGAGMTYTQLLREATKAGMSVKVWERLVVGYVAMFNNSFMLQFDLVFWKNLNSQRSTTITICVAESAPKHFLNNARHHISHSTCALLAHK